MCTNYIVPLVLQALRKRGVDFSFVSPQHLACQDVMSRIGRAFVAAQVSSALCCPSCTWPWLQRRYNEMLDLQGLPGRSQLRLLRSGCMDALQSLPGPLNCLNDDFLREQVPRLQSGLHALQWKIVSLETSHSQPRTLLVPLTLYTMRDIMRVGLAGLQSLF